PTGISKNLGALFSHSSRLSTSHSSDPPPLLKPPTGTRYFSSNQRQLAKQKKKPEECEVPISIFHQCGSVQS
ncbi:Hypothetical predicted protein, partial [Olea europaea subsp. europaea]